MLTSQKKSFLLVFAALFVLSCGGGEGRDAVDEADTGEELAELTGGEEITTEAEQLEEAEITEVLEVEVCAKECYKENEHGRCYGKQLCDDGGFSECDAPEPEAEKCDGKDNDCDGQTDENPEILCNDGITCTTDKCAGENGCENPVEEKKCLIEGKCYNMTDLNPANECEMCLPPESQIAWSNAPVGCSDGNVCTTRDVCENGVCVGKDNVCECAETSDCLQFDDENKCNGSLYCNKNVFPNVCEVDPETVIVCDSKEDTKCKVNICDPETGECSMTAVFEGEECSDGDDCTKGDKCEEGICKGTDYDCNDNLSCTEDYCDGEGGCSHILIPYYCLINNICVLNGDENPLNPCQYCNSQLKVNEWSNSKNLCDDGNACTKNDICKDGECVGESYLCADDLACTSEECDGKGGCIVDVDGGFCLIDSTCVAAQTKNGDNECEWCDPLLDQFGWSFHNLPCDDGNECTTNDSCVSGVCVGGDPLDCDDGDICTTDSCDKETGCRHDANSNPCDDGNECTVGDKCEDKMCKSGSMNVCDCITDEECPVDDNLCNGKLICNLEKYPYKCETDPATVVSCPPDNDTECSKNMCVPWEGTCAMTPVNENGKCDDGDPCTYGEKCTGGECVGTAYQCSDGLACTADLCNGDGTCEFKLNDGFCLIGGVCYVAGDANPDNFCQTCDPSKNKNTWSNKPDNTQCDDGESCSHSDACKNGICKGTIYNCNDNLACTNDICKGDGTCDNSIKADFCLIDGVCYANGYEKSQCQYCDSASKNDGWTNRPETTVCDDGDKCTMNDRCNSSNGQCAGTAYLCDDGKWCTVDKCLGDGNCEATELVEKSCLINGVCYLKGEENSANMCEWCQPENNKTAWSPKSDNTPCSDNDECTVNDKCLNGTCKAGNPMLCDDYNPCTENRCDPQEGCVYPSNDIFREDFDNDYDFTFVNSDPVVGWDVVSPPGGWYGFKSLYYGNIDAANYDTPGEANSGVALSNTMISLDGQSSAYLSFDLYLGNEWSNYFATGGGGRWNYDYLEAVLYLEDNTEVVVWSSNWWVGENYWISYKGLFPAKPKLLRVSGIDLLAVLSNYGNNIPKFQLGFRFNTIDEYFNNFEGVLIDNIVIGSSCADNDACTQGESCQNGTCKGLEKVCDDADDCTNEQCDQQNGCMYTFTQGGNSCNDYNLCTNNTVCDNTGSCGGGDVVTCPDDNNDCTSDACDPLAGCSYKPVPDYSACSQANPHGTCIGGKCVPWEIKEIFIGDLNTAFFAIDRSPDDGGGLYMAGAADKPDGNITDPVTQTNFLIDTVALSVSDIFQNPDYTPGMFFDISGRLAVGFDFDTMVYKTASWGSWSFAQGDVPQLTPTTGLSPLLTVTNFNNTYFLAGYGATANTKTFIHKCYWNEFSSKWEPEPCYNLAAFDNYNDCNEFSGLEIYSSWAMNGSSVFIGGRSLDQVGNPQFTILYYDGNSMTNCGSLDGFTGIFYKHDYYGMLVPSSGDGYIYGIHGSDLGNIWAVGSDGAIFHFDWSWNWQQLNPADWGISWDNTHEARAVYTDGNHLHIVGRINSTGDAFYLHGAKNQIGNWLFDRKIVFSELSSSDTLLNDIIVDPLTSDLYSVGYRYDATSEMYEGLLLRLDKPDVP